MDRRVIQRVCLRISLAINVILLFFPLWAALRDEPSALGLSASRLLRKEDRSQEPLYDGDQNAAWDQEESHVFQVSPEPDAGTPSGAAEALCQPPAKSCSMCEAGPVGKKLCEEWGEDVLTRALAYSGTNHRLRRVLAKMRRGEPFTIGVIGGSVSTGHGLYTPGGEQYSPENMHSVFFDYLNSTFPAPEGSVIKTSHVPGKNAFVNGAEPARGSDYYSMCNQLHVPTDADLIVVELAINDPPHPNNVVTFELLIRSLLEYPNQPAVLLLNTFALMFDNIAMGGDMNHGAAQYYDVPTLSTRNGLLPLASANKTKLPEWFAHERKAGMTVDWDRITGVDLRHFGPKLHRFSGELMSAYIESQLCEMDQLEKTSHLDPDELYPLEPLPSVRLMDKWGVDKNEVKLKPFCRATNSDEFPLEAKEQHGWEPWAWKDKKYLVAKDPGAKIVFPFSTTQGSVILYYLRSREFNLGNLECWIDNNRAGSAKVCEGYWTEPFNIGRTTTWGGLSPGDHTLSCEVLEETDDPDGEHEFRLMALMSI